jgi:hypothetical protein
MTNDPLGSWLIRQSPEVRAELENLLAYKPEPEFIRTLAELLPSVPQAGLIDLYYDIFHCCRPVFRIAVRQLHSPAELADFLLLAERVLIDAADNAAFAAACSDDDDVDEVIFWLKRQALAQRQKIH